MNKTKRNTIEERPAGTTASIAAAAVAIAALAGVDLSAEAAAAIIGGVTALVSLFTPR